MKTFTCKGCGVIFLPQYPRAASKGPPIYCSRRCSQPANARKGAGVKGKRGRHLLKTGRCLNKDGYVRVLVGDHPFKRRYHYMFEHVRVIEAAIGRRITPTECIHHVNGDITDNRVQNLRLMSKSEHAKLHRRQGARHARP